jgi:hypothetical protein
VSHGATAISLASRSRTDAYRDKRGKLQLAHRGTLFLDEVDEMSLPMQALLRVLENSEIQVAGDEHSQARLDVRAIAATNRVGSNESTRFATRAFVRGHFRESEVAPMRNARVHAADWPGPAVSSGQGQTSMREESACGCTGVGSFAASGSMQSRSPALHGSGAQLARPLLISEARAIRTTGTFKEFADKSWRHCRTPARAVPVKFNRPAHGE